MNKVQYTVKPKDMSKRLDKLAKSLRNPLPAMKKISIFIDRWAQKNFSSEGGKVGGWPAFKHGGRINSEGRGELIQVVVPWGVIDVHLDKSAKLLQDTGTLRLHTKPFFNKFNAGLINDLDYAEAHQEGKGNSPQRKFIPDGTEREVIDGSAQILNDYIKESGRGIVK